MRDCRIQIAMRDQSCRIVPAVVRSHKRKLLILLSVWPFATTSTQAVGRPTRQDFPKGY
jgi:hypothetical protein